MRNRFKRGQKVRITPVRSQSPVRDADLEPYTGQTAEVVDFYWVSPTPGQQFYIYTVKVLVSNKKVVVHEDELEPSLE
jgi:hypothetical protein